MATLENWENTLKQRLAGVDLIGELDLTQEQTQELGRLIAELIRSEGPQDAIRSIERRYPSAFAAYLVFQGGHGYDRGDFWGGVCTGAGLPNEGNYTVAAGQAFERICRRFGFTHGFAGYRYVGAILGHGGVPARSLPDFFEHMLQPSIVKPELAGLSTPELIDEWLVRSSQYFVHKPVLRFLEYGGRVAEDFVERCRQMATEYVSEGAVPLASDVGLPESVIEGYQAWIDSSGQTRSGQTIKLRYRRPEMLIDPWSLGVYLHLPEQPISANRHGKLRWEIEVNGHLQSVPVRVRRVDMDLKTEAADYPLDEPASNYWARLHVDDDLLGAWRFDGPGADSPLLIFDPERRTPLSASGARSLPGQVLWVIAAPEVTVATEPSHNDMVREQLPRLSWGWHDWQCLAIDLTGAREFIWNVDAKPQRLTVRDPGGESQPELVDAMQIEPLADRVPLFVGRPPRLRIPWSSDERSESALRRWRFELRYDWEAEPAARVSIVLSELRDRLLWKDDSVEIPLDDRSLLGSAPTGQFRVKVRGPLGSTQELRFRMTPRLGVTGHEQVIVPDPHKGALPVELLVETDARSEVQFLQDEPAFGLELAVEDAETRYYCIEAPPDRVEAPLRLVRTLAPGRNTYIPLRMPIRRLRWMLVLDPADVARPNWLGEAHAPASLGELERCGFPSLIVELPLASEGEPTVRLQFMTGKEDVIWEGSAQVSPGTSRFCRFDLRLVLDSIRQSRSALVRAYLVVKGLPGYDEIRLLAFSVRQGISVQAVTAVPHQTGDGLHLHLRWQPEIPLRGRYVRFWSQTRPWHAPVGIQLPDGARHEHIAQVASDALPAGVYLVEFTVRDPWLPETQPGRPSASADNVVEAQVGDLEQRLAELVDGRDDTSLSFDEHYERILLRQTMGDRPGVEHDLQSCYEHAHLASVQQLITLTDELETSIPTVKALRYKLYRADRIKEMLDACQAGGLSEADLRSYLSHVPPIALQSPATCRVLLAAPDDQLRLTAAISLIKSHEPEAVKAVLAWAEMGELSEADTLRLLDVNISLTTRVLDATPLTPLVVSLWEQLARLHPDEVLPRFVRPGQWVRCQAGWGRIERIEGPDGARLDVVAIADLARGYRLHVVLRPGEDSERVVIDVSRRKVDFSDDAIRYHCSTCQCCAVREERRLYYEHRKAAHPIHKSEGYGVSIVRQNLSQTRNLEFSFSRPTQLWV